MFQIDSSLLNKVSGCIATVPSPTFRRNNHYEQHCEHVNNTGESFMWTIETISKHQNRALK